MRQHNQNVDLIATMLHHTGTGVSSKESLFGIGGREIFGNNNQLNHTQTRIVKNLGNVFHSEVIYYYFLQINQLKPCAYFFSQRDLCETCRPIVNKQSEFYTMNTVVLSAIPAQGRSQGEGPTVDEELLLSNSGWLDRNGDLIVTDQLHIDSATTSKNLLRIRIPSFQ